MALIRFSEQLLASAVGSASARLILSLLFQRHDKSSKDAFRLLDDATEALQQNRDLLQIALDQMEQGITVFDKDFRLTCWNRQYRALFDLPDEMGQVGVSLDRILRHLAERGDIGHDAIVSVLDRLTNFGAPWQIALKTSGRTIELRSNPMPDGGLVATYADITARVEADLALKRVNETLEQRVRNRTAELTRVNEELAQAQMLAEEANLGKTRFLAAAGHDILQPLNAARLYCASLIERAAKGDAADAAANIESSLELVEIDPRRGARHFTARRRRHEAVRDRVQAWRADAPDRHRLHADGRREEARSQDRAVVDRGEHRPQPAASPDPEPGLQRHQIHPQRPRAGRRPAARRTGRIAGDRHRHRHRLRQAQSRCSASSRGSTKARAKRAASASACRSSTGSRAC